MTRFISLAVACVACSAAPPRSDRIATSLPPTDAATRRTSPEGNPADDQAWRANRPAAMAGMPFEFPDAGSLRLPGGIRVLVVERHSVPIVVVRLLIAGGQRADPEAQRGLAYMTASAIEEELSNDRVAARLEVAGAEVEVMSSFDASYVTLTAPRQRLEEALAIVADVVTHPAFRDEELAVVKERALDALHGQLSDASRVLFGAVRHLMYGRKNPYAWLSMGTEDTIKGIWVRILCVDSISA